MSFLLNKIRIQKWACIARSLARLPLWGQDSVKSYATQSGPSRLQEGRLVALLLLHLSAGLDVGCPGVLLARTFILCHTPQYSNSRSLIFVRN